MHDFTFINNRLFCEGVAVEHLARQFGTPLYVYSHKTILDHFHKLEKSFSHFNPLICYSLKANSSLGLVRILVQEGAGLDIVSGGELFKALKTGVNPKKIVYASVGKTEAEIIQAIRAGILFFNVESEAELALINRLAKRLRKRVQVAIRINPDIEPKTHAYITTGKLTNKFGISLKDARKIFLDRRKFTFVRINGVHMHIGSQIITSKPFVGALRRVIAFIRQLEALKVNIEYLNIGGGLGIIYKNEKPQTADEFASNIIPLLKGLDCRLILEPGRFIVGNAGILVTKVIYVKRSYHKTFVIVDAGMNDLIRPALYGAHHEIVPLRKRGTLTLHADVVGPICESADFFAKNRKMHQVAPGDLLAVMSAGAYGFSMSSNYNSRLRPAEVMVSQERFSLIRQREGLEDLIRKERFVKF